MAKIITCMKAVPDRSSRLVIREDKRWVRDEDLTFGAGEADEYALEAALGIVEAQGGEVVVLTLGDARAGRLLRTALAKGAERAIHLSDPAFEGGDELATARVLARAVAGDGGADLVLTGVESGDLGSGVTGIMMAELLGWTHASVVIRIDGDISSGRVEVARELEGGRTELDRDEFDTEIELRRMHPEWVSAVTDALLLVSDAVQSSIAEFGPDLDIARNAEHGLPDFILRS
jgi:electron transfer flavoprotein beta subunit